MYIYAICIFALYFANMKFSDSFANFIKINRIRVE